MPETEAEMQSTDAADVSTYRWATLGCARIHLPEGFVPKECGGLAALAHEPNLIRLLQLTREEIRSSAQVGWTQSKFTKHNLKIDCADGSDFRLLGHKLRRGTQLGVSMLWSVEKYSSNEETGEDTHKLLLLGSQPLFFFQLKFAKAIGLHCHPIAVWPLRWYVETY